VDIERVLNVTETCAKRARA